MRDLTPLRDRFVRAVGKPVAWSVEEHINPRQIDHVWITVHAPEFGTLKISLSTRSRKSRDAGFDERVRLGIVPDTWAELPASGVDLSPPFDYAEIERAKEIAFSEIEDSAFQALLVDKAKRAKLVEAWGDLYVRPQRGLHQIHSRRASFAMPRDVVGRDGAIRFYFDENRREMLLMKFAGQP